MIHKIFIISFLAIFLLGCQDVQRQLSMEKKENLDEFLIKKKNPLVLPPEFSKLPEPSTKINKVDDIDQEIDLSKVLNKSENSEISNQSKDLEKSISNIINKK